MPKGRKAKQLDMEAIKGMYEAGMSTSEIGESMGVSGPTIYNRLKQMDVQMRPRGRAKSTSKITEEVLSEESEKKELSIEDVVEMVKVVKVTKLGHYTLEDFDKAIANKSFVQKWSGKNIHMVFQHIYEDFFKDPNTDEYIFVDREKELLIHTRMTVGCKLNQKKLDAWKEAWLSSRKRSKLR